MRMITCSFGQHEFELKEGEAAAYAKFGFEPLSICFRHQHMLRLAFRNDRFLHRRTCDLTGASIVSMYPQDAPYTIYERNAWYSDRWDALTYGRAFDFNRPFFEQYAELQKEVPRMAIANFNCENSDYCNSCVSNKNSYLIFGGDRNEDCLYGSFPMYCRACVDCDWGTYNELCYYAAYSERCYSCQYAFNSKNCADCAYIEDCVGCTECIMSFNLRNKSYYIGNKPYSKEEYFERKAQLLTGSRSARGKLWGTFLVNRAHRDVKFARVLNVENVSGDYIFNSKNCFDCFEVIGGEDCRQLLICFHVKDCFNADCIGTNSVLNYNNLSTDSCYRAWMSYWTVSSQDVEYSELIMSSKNIFGSIGLRNQEYCILNRKYPPAEFAAMREKIIEHMKKTGEWGRFFPPQLSTFPYNNSTASIFFPLSKEDAIAFGFQWHDETPSLSSQPPAAVPDNIAEATDQILQQNLQCEITGKEFRVTAQELAFYRKFSLPIPVRHPDQRYLDRLALHNPLQLWDRACGACGEAVQSSFVPGRSERILCEKCYLKAVY